MTCPSWHFLPGPYGDDSGRTECPNRDTHAEQRKEYMATTQKSISIAPTAATVARLAEEGNVPKPSATILMAHLAVEQGLGDVPIDRLSLSLNVESLCNCDNEHSADCLEG